MKLISLNIWGGHVDGLLKQFFESNRETDFFFLQEVYSNSTQRMSTDNRFVNFRVLQDIESILPDHRSVFKPVLGTWYGIAVFLRKDFVIENEGEVSIYENPHYPGQGPAHRRILQWIKVRNGNQIFTIVNLHGLWNGKGKTDSPDRIQQSIKIRDFLKTVETPRIVCGDFNLRPDTESIQLVSEGMEDLICNSGVQSTRTSLYDKEEKFADYIFVSPEVKVERFEVRSDVVSDHAPLYLEFSLSTKTF